LQLQPSNQLLPNASKRSDTLILLLSNAAKQSETSKTLLSNGAKRSETDPPKAQAQRIYIPLGGLPPKARKRLFALSLIIISYLLSLIISYLLLSSQSQFHLELSTDRQNDSNVHGIVDGQNLLYIRYVQYFSYVELFLKLTGYGVRYVHTQENIQKKKGFERGTTMGRDLT